MSKPTPLDPITIVGAGPSGLLLARYLQLHRIPTVIYEREPHRSSRLQGGTLDLHDDTGLLALRETGLLEDARGLMRGSGEALKIVDKAGKVWMDENTYDKLGRVVVGDEEEGVTGEIRGRPEIDRTDLRNLLIDSLHPNTIKWDHAIASCTALSPTSYELTFASPTQSRVITSYLIGADGTFSLVRPLLHGHKPDYSGVTMYDLTVPASSMTPALQAYVGAGSLMALGEGKGVMPQMNARGVCKVYAGLKVPHEWVDRHPLPENGKREHIASLFDGWHKEAKEVILAADEASITPRRIWQFDPDLKWESELAGVTLMGDSAHCASPFAGEGVNQALADALDLGHTFVALCIVPAMRASAAPFPLSLFPLAPPPSERPQLAPPPAEKLRKALRAYEKRMMSRVRPYAIESRANLELAFGFADEDGSRNAAKDFVSAFRWMIASAIAGMVVRAPVSLLEKIWRDFV